jgi:para-nitrobenzyl esterase
MKKLYICLTSALFLFLAGNEAQAQCSGIRYRDFMFTDSVTSNIQYGQNLRYNSAVFPLTMDMHMPKADPAPTNRPLIILAHGGSFVQGDKAGSDVLPLAKDFARMGYVVASINYRLGMDGFPATPLDSFIATRAVMRAVQDAHAAVRFFRKSFVNGNPYGIDTSKIFFDGVSAGAFMGLHLAYLNQANEFPVWCDTTKPGLSGGIEGVSGNPGYPSNVKAIINICGAIGDTNWIKPGATPVLSFHGDADGTVPYGTAHIVVFGTTLQTVHGSHSIMLRANHVGLPNCFDQWVGQNHVPEVGSPAYYDTCLNISRNYLVHFLCGDAMYCEYKNPLGIVEHDLQHITLNCYPNPSNGSVHIDLSAVYGEEVTLSLYNNMGQEVRQIKGIRDAQFTLERGDLPNGLYLVDVIVKGKRYVSRLLFN